MKVQIIHNAKNATGTAVIIDVFRAFTVEPYLISNEVKKLIPVGDIQRAYDYKRNNKNCILIGERNGIKQPGFDYGNSPSQIEKVNFSGKTVIHTTSCGTKGIINAENAKEILTGSLVNANAISEYIIRKNVEEVSLVSLARLGESPAEEDELCARYIKSLLENNPLRNLNEEIEKLKLTSGSKFFSESMQDVFPKKDFYLCTEVNKFNFVLKVNSDIKDELYIERIDL